MTEGEAAVGAVKETTVFLSHFEDLPDYRQKGKVAYPLAEVLLLMLAGALAGAESVASPCHRPGMDARGVPADAQGWSVWRRRRDGGAVRGEPGGQPFGAPGAHQVRLLCRPAGASGLHSEGGRFGAAARHSDVRGQGGTAGDRHGAGADL